VNARRLGLAVLAATLVGSGTYVFVYLNRWEWNRAIISGVIFIIAEMALIGALLAQRITNLDRRVTELAERGPQTLTRLRENRPPAKAGFAWLGRPDQLNVFVPVLMGAGVVLSAIAWIVERLARMTARPVAERALAHRMGSLSLPRDGFLDGEHDHLDLLRGPLLQVDR
jgi:hypothetical protein